MENKQRFVGFPIKHPRVGRCTQRRRRRSADRSEEIDLAVRARPALPPDPRPRAGAPDHPRRGWVPAPRATWSTGSGAATPDECALRGTTARLLRRVDGIVNENLVERLRVGGAGAGGEVLYGFQIAMENIHSETYSS